MAWYIPIANLASESQVTSDKLRDLCRFRLGEKPVKGWSISNLFPFPVAAVIFVDGSAKPRTSEPLCNIASDLLRGTFSLVSTLPLSRDLKSLFEQVMPFSSEASKYCTVWIFWAIFGIHVLSRQLSFLNTKFLVSKCYLENNPGRQLSVTYNLLSIFSRGSLYIFVLYTLRW